MSENVYHESERTVAMLKSGEIPKGSVLKVRWPSGNWESVRFHYWNGSRQNAFNKEVMMGCNMGWDNSALDSYDLSSAVVSLISKPKQGDERWSANKTKEI